MRFIIKSILTAILFLSSGVLFSQNRITVDLEDFSALYVSGRIDVELIPSDSKEMSITSKKGQPEEVSVEVKDGELKIKIRPRLDNDEVIGIRLPYTNLTRIESLTGAVINSARDLKADNLELIAAAGGKIELSLETGTITAKVSHMSDIVLYGKAESQNVNVNTGGNYFAYDLECKDTYIKVSSGSQGKVTASRKIEAIANGKGFIGYIGNPESTYTKTSLGGEIISYKTRPEVLD